MIMGARQPLLKSFSLLQIIYQEYLKGFKRR
jgi:hypothetical protein